jgi:hypothetical protein
MVFNQLKRAFLIGGRVRMAGPIGNMGGEKKVYNNRINPPLIYTLAFPRV